jgi:hypothetical protein
MDLTMLQFQTLNERPQGLFIFSSVAFFLLIMDSPFLESRSSPDGHIHRCPLPIHRDHQGAPVDMPDTYLWHGVLPETPVGGG